MAEEKLYRVEMFKEEIKEGKLAGYLICRPLILKGRNVREVIDWVDASCEARLVTRVCDMAGKILYRIIFDESGLPIMAEYSEEK